MWSDPVPLTEYLARIDTRLDAAKPGVREFRAFIVGLCDGFRCDKHPSAAPSIEYTRDKARYRCVCAPCRDPGLRLHSLMNALAESVVDDPESAS